MKRVATLLTLLICCTIRAAVAVPGGAGISLDAEVSALSGKYLGFYSSVPSDSVEALCRRAASEALTQGNYEARFRAQQLAVNALCIKGKLDQSVDMAQQMYDEAKRMGKPFEKALALQAIGATYMHAGQYEEALSTFGEAEPLIRDSGDTLARLKLVVQQLHTCMLVNDTVQTAALLIAARRLAERIPSAERPLYLFYLDAYQTVQLIRTNHPLEAHAGLERTLRSKPAGGSFERWSYYMQASYYNLTDDIERAIRFNDSTQRSILGTGNMNEYRKSLIDEVFLIEKTGRIKDACDVYERIDALTDSLNITQYTERINALHTTYQVDQMALNNIAARNRLLSSIIFYGLGLVVLIAALVVLIVRKNRQLEHSRLKLATAGEAASDSIRSKSMFLSNMSHELRTPLNAIVGFSAILADTDEVDAETKQLCRQNIEQNSELLLKLVGDIVDFSELKSSKIKLTFDRCDAVSLCRQVVETVDKVKQTAAALSFSTSLQSLGLYTDKGRLQQVLINLLVNATKFTHEGSIRLTMNVDEQRNEAVFAVEDTGCGIPPEKQAQIFERFEKLHEGIQGVGLGLSICLLIVDQLGGRIWIDPLYTQGARFVFTHPLENRSDAK